MPARSKTAASSPAATGEGPSFEAALERLETIVEELEGGELTLEQSLAHYEEGMRLSRRLTQTLDQAEKRIERLVEEDGAAPTTRPLEEQPDAEGRETGGSEGELPF